VFDDRMDLRVPGVILMFAIAAAIVAGTATAGASAFHNCGAITVGATHALDLGLMIPAAQTLLV